MGFFGKKQDSISKKEPRLNSLKYEQSTFGATKAVLYGTNRLCGNIIDSVDFKATAHKNTVKMGKGGSQKSTSIYYTYTARTVIGLCEGQIQGIRKIMFDDGTYSLADLKLNLFQGSDNQPAWGEMVTKHADHALNYRNLAYVAGNIDLTTNGSVPQYNFEVSGKFTNNTDDITPVITEGFTYSTDSGTLGSVTANIEYSEYYTSINKIELVYYNSNNREYRNDNFTGYTVTQNKGVYTVTLNLSGLGAVSAHAYITYNSTVRLDANPKDIVYDVLTDSNYGMGFSAAELDTNSFETYSDYCIANNVFLSPLYDSQSEAQEVLSNLGEITNSTFVWSQGKLRVVPLGDSEVSDNGKTFIPDLTPIYDITEDDLLCDDGDEPIICERKSQNDVKNSVKIEYLNRANEYNTEIEEAQDLVNIELYGLKQADTLTARQICTQEVANKVAQLALQRNIAVRNTYSFKLSMKYCLLEPMDLITLTSDRLGMSRELVRILSVKENDGVLEFTAEEMIVGTATPAKITGQTASFEGVNTATSVGNINAPIIFEPPFELTQDELQVWVGISNPQNLFGGGEVWISDDGETYKNIGTLNDSVRQGVLTAALPTINAEYDNTNTLAIDVSMSNAELLSGSDNDMENLNTLCYVDGELLSYKNAELVDDFEYEITTMKRGAYYTQPTAHNSGTQFCRIDTDCFMKVPFNEDDIGKKIYIKICSFNTFGAGLQDLANVTAYEYKILGNATMIFPNNVTNFNVIQKGSDYVFSWNFTSNEDTYEIREGANWDTGTVIGKNIALNSFSSHIIMTGEKHFWIKSFNGMNYSDAATHDVIYVDSIPDSNVVVAYDLLTDLDNGTYQNTKQYKGAIKLTTAVKWQTTADKWGMGSNKYYQIGGVWGAAVASEGYYTSAVQDLGGVLESGVRGTIGLHSENETLTAEIQWRYSADSETWSDWETLTSDGVIATFRYYQCRVHFTSTGGQIVCTAANIIIDVPDKLVTRTAVVSNASTGATVEFDFYAPPSIVATVNDNINAYAVVIEKDEQHAKIKIFDNDGTAVTGTADLIIKGY